MGKESMTHDEQAIILKGIASQILQMNMPTFTHLKKMLEVMNVADWVVDPLHSDEVYKRALLMCMIISNGCNKQFGQSFGDRIEDILTFANMFEDAGHAVKALSLKK